MVKGICKGKKTNCPWSIWALKYEKNSDAFMIKTLNDKHTCPRINKNRHANSGWLSRRYTKELRHGGNFKISDFLGQVRKDFVVQPSKTQVYRAKLMAGELIEGIDADNGYYPITYVVVEKEWHESWSWFLQLLKEDLNLEDYLGITFMTDRQKGLVESICDIWPICEHRFCVRHMYANFKKKFKDDIIKGKLWKAARSTKVEDFQTYMAEIKELNENAWKWLNEISLSQWSNSFFSIHSKCDMTLNNLCEIVNGDREVLEARSSPIYSLLEMLRIKIMNRRASRKANLKMWYQDIGPKISEVLDLEAKKSGNFVAH
ncbi:hypothetical protein LWI29_024743 [Acer saccharum]|uniref:MULE transposase domain-containing protein n=1 Tax=Acer saccharum TaxID=4024 RepID=A0AA39S4F6_ACESA|nr:hypothetical protein LWI29_024743 [Acer saccharum]